MAFSDIYFFVVICEIATTFSNNKCQEGAVNSTLPKIYEEFFVSERASK